MATLNDIGEFGWIKRMARLVPGAPSVIAGIGDDCAVLRVGDRLLLMSCDLAVEGVHFRRNLSPEDIGWKAAASALSDIAAMGGLPLFALVSLGCPGATETSFLEGLYSGLVDACSQAGATIVGGDTTESPDGVVIDVTVLGEAIGGRYLLRKGAQPGDVLAVTGLLGLSAAGRHALEHGHDAPALVRAHAHPAPRVTEGQWLSACPEVHALIDISDGLVQDAGHLAEASMLGLDVHPALLPIAPSLTEYCEAHGLDPYAFALAGGEDYELAFAIDGAKSAETVAALRREFPHTEITIAGTFTDAWAGTRVAGRAPAQTGFDHFKPH